MSKKKRAPLIGVTCEVVYNRQTKAMDYVCDSRYMSAIKRAGGYPVLLPISKRTDVMRRYLEAIDGLIIIGGDDVDPALYGQAPKRTTRIINKERLAFETWLYRWTRIGDIPLFAICYGMQLVNVLEGGTLFQHLPSSGKKTSVRHRSKTEIKHSVYISKGTRLQKILKTTHALVPTEHHQAVDKLGKGFHSSALAEDGTIEAIERESLKNILAVQWHPERDLESDITARLFSHFIKLCRQQ